jgi:methylated-DNA-[protein]-cysteine S-methyltransferase
VELQIDRVTSPIGTLVLITDSENLCGLDFEDYFEPRLLGYLQKNYTGFDLKPVQNSLGISQHLEDYFAGNLHSLDNIPVNAVGTPFQQAVWLGLRHIPPGRTCTYGELATQIGYPNAVRAVGAANGQNPIAIVLPCHRVIGANGTLTGYAGGLERKRWLLEHESIKLAPPMLQLELVLS